jgi:hypothetical protein
MIGQPQIAKISVFARLLNYSHVTFWAGSCLNGVPNCEALAPYLSGTAEGEITASATSFMVMRRSMAAR